MNWHQLRGLWKQGKGYLLQRWGQLTGDEFSSMMGKRESTDGKILKAYGDSAARSGRRAAGWQRRLKTWR